MCSVGPRIPETSVIRRCAHSGDARKSRIDELCEFAQYHFTEDASSAKSVINAAILKNGCSTRINNQD